MQRFCFSSSIFLFPPCDLTIWVFTQASAEAEHLKPTKQRPIFTTFFSSSDSLSLSLCLSLLSVALHILSPHFVDRKKEPHLDPIPAFAPIFSLFRLARRESNSPTFHYSISQAPAPVFRRHCDSESPVSFLPLKFGGLFVIRVAYLFNRFTCGCNMLLLFVHLVICS